MGLKILLLRSVFEVFIVFFWHLAKFYRKAKDWRDTKIKMATCLYYIHKTIFANFANEPTKYLSA